GRMLKNRLKQLQMLFRYTCVGFAVLFSCLLFPSLKFSLLIDFLILSGSIITALIIARYISWEW
ncbi:hypothetical protein ACX43S_25235, partial [Enterobacter cloacae]